MGQHDSLICDLERRVRELEEENQRLHDALDEIISVAQRAH